jgi:excisionase family DNA binding protein
MLSSNQALTVQEYAQKVGVSASTVSKWLRNGKLKGHKQNGKWVVAAETSSPKSSSVTALSKSTTSSDAGSKKAFFSIEKFSQMTYLTEFGIAKWLKEGRLKGVLDTYGQWQIAEENLADPHIKRLLRS